ncbi:MAG: GxxExxY protein [Verrucomicrobiota bacterium JB022]|nr:GxxExxY protein [Verrucomicrobiota bacterium JB022]
MIAKQASHQELSAAILKAAYSVHTALGPGLLESLYEQCLAYELTTQGFKCERQKLVKVRYRDLVLEHTLKCDLIVNNAIIVELKAVEAIIPIHKAQIMSYMKLLNLEVGLLLNFHEVSLKNGIHRLYLNEKQHSF